MGHDVTEPGLHLDVYRDGEKDAVNHDYPPVYFSYAIRYRESALREKADELVSRFERWHDVNHENR